MAHNINKFKKCKSKRPDGIPFGHNTAEYISNSPAIHLMYLTVYAFTYTMEMVVYFCFLDLVATNMSKTAAP